MSSEMEIFLLSESAGFLTQQPSDFLFYISVIYTKFKRQLKSNIICLTLSKLIPNTWSSILKKSTNSHSPS